MRLQGPIYLGPRRIEITSVEHSCEMPSMNDDVPARDAEGQTSFYAKKTAQSLYAQLGFRQSEFGQGPCDLPGSLHGEVLADSDGLCE